MRQYIEVDITNVSREDVEDLELYLNEGCWKCRNTERKED